VNGQRLRPMERVVVRLSDAGADAAEIGRRFARSPEHIQRILGFTRLPSRSAPAGHRKLSPLEQRVLRWRDAGAGWAELADRFGKTTAFLAQVEKLARYKLGFDAPGRPDFQQAMESADMDAIASVLAADIVFRSPVAHRPYAGRDAVLPILRAVIDVFEGLRYTDRIESPNRTVLFFAARVGSREVEGIDALRLDAEGKVRELVVMIRPLSALNAVAEEIGRHLT